MAEIVLVRNPSVQARQADRDAAMRVLLGHIDGLSAGNQKAWRRFLRRLLALVPGDCIEIITHQKRLSWYHRKHMSFEFALFKAQDKFDDFDRFRDWLKVGAAHVEWLPTASGPVPIPKSISYSSMEQGAMEQFHGHVVDFMRTAYAGQTLWPHLAIIKQIEMVEGVLGGYGE